MADASLKHDQTWNGTTVKLTDNDDIIKGDLVFEFKPSDDFGYIEMTIQQGDSPKIMQLTLSEHQVAVLADAFAFLRNKR